MKVPLIPCCSFTTITVRKVFPNSKPNLLCYKTGRMKKKSASSRHRAHRKEFWYLLIYQKRFYLFIYLFLCSHFRPLRFPQRMLFVYTKQGGAVKYEKNSEGTLDFQASSSRDRMQCIWPPWQTGDWETCFPSNQILFKHLCTLILQSMKLTSLR